MNTTQKIGKILNSLRISRGLSQEQLSIQSGIDQHYISNIENGLRNPSIEIIEKLVSFFGYTLSRFFIEVETLEDSTNIIRRPVLEGESEVDGFSAYMYSINLSDATAKKYSENVPNCQSVKAIIRKQSNGRTDNMYHVRDESELKAIIDAVADSEFDKIGQRMYSCGLKKYLSYLKEIR